MAKSPGFPGLFEFLAKPCHFLPMVAAPHFAPPLHRIPHRFGPPGQSRHRSLADSAAPQSERRLPNHATTTCKGCSRVNSVSRVARMFWKARSHSLTPARLHIRSKVVRRFALVIRWPATQNLIHVL